MLELTFQTSGEENEYIWGNYSNETKKETKRLKTKGKVKRKIEEGRRGSQRKSSLQQMTRSRAKTRRLEKRGVESDLGQEAQRQRCPSPKSFLSLSFPHSSFPRESWRGNAGRALPLPSSICASLGVLSFFVISFSLLSLFSQQPFFLIPPPYSIFSPHNSPLSAPPHA